MNKFSGRLKTFIKTIYINRALYTNGYIRKLQKCLKEQKEAEEEQFLSTGSREVMLTSKQIKKLRLAQDVVVNAIHPDTGDFIPFIMRFSTLVML